MDKVLELRLNVAISFPGESLMSITWQKHKAIMRLHPAGVMVDYKSQHVLIPYASVIFARLEEAVAVQQKAKVA